MDSKKFLADFQIVANRVSDFNFKTFSLGKEEIKTDIKYDIDYNIIKIDNNESNWSAIEQLIVTINGKSGDDDLFILKLIMEGIFVGDVNKLDREKFIQRLELNGLATLSHLSRAYIVSVSSLSGINPPLKLPMFNIHSLIKIKKEKNFGNIE